MSTDRDCERRISVAVYEQTKMLQTQAAHVYVKGDDGGYRMEWNDPNHFGWTPISKELLESAVDNINGYYQALRMIDHLVGLLEIRTANQGE